MRKGKMKKIVLLLVALVLMSVNAGAAGYQGLADQDGETVMSPVHKSSSIKDKVKLAIEIGTVPIAVMIYVFDIKAENQVQRTEIENLKKEIGQLQRDVRFLNQAHMQGPVRVSP
jgi:hypothetical protein